MTRFFVAQDWVPEDEFDDASKAIMAHDARTAAEQYFEAEHSNLDYCAIITLKVRDSDTGIITRWNVEAIQTMQAYATPARED